MQILVEGLNFFQLSNQICHEDMATNGNFLTVAKKCGLGLNGVHVLISPPEYKQVSV